VGQPNAAAAQRALGVYEFATDDLDEAVEFVTRNFGVHSRVPRARGPLGYFVSASVAERSAAGLTSFGLRSMVRAASPAVTLHLPLRTGSQYQVGRRRLESTPNAAVVLAPGHDYSVDSCPGEVAAIMLEPALLEQELDLVRGGRRGRVGPKSTRLLLSEADVGSLRQLIGRHRVAVSGALHGVAAGQLHAVEARVAAWLARRLVQTSALAALPPSRQDAAERVEGWIRRHVSQPISLQQLSAVAGLPGRTLQEACQARWGHSPIELVTSRRLEVVRSLLTSRSSTTVSDAALRAGFTHLGRFSILYRRVFGESPSDTLAGRRLFRIERASGPCSSTPDPSEPRVRRRFTLGA
jgi:AraC-like DNA-binding protein